MGIQTEPRGTECPRNTLILNAHYLRYVKRQPLKVDLIIDSAWLRFCLTPDRWDTN